MKFLFVLLAFCFVPVLMNGQQKNPDFDQALSDSLEGDDYGMRSYVLVILKTGNANLSKQASDSIFSGHIKNIIRLAAEKKLIVSGPLKKNDQSYRGIFILNAKTIEEGRQLLSTDPAIQANLLSADLFQWFGSAALPAYLETHKRIEKIKM